MLADLLTQADVQQLLEITVKIHRGHIMKKMGTGSLADLLRITEMLGIQRAKP